MVDHNALTEELKHLNVSQCLIRWIGAFLSFKLQRVMLNGSLSAPVFPNGGIPQGTRLAPLLFAILVNGLASFWPCRVKYVDDTTVFEIIPRCSPSYLPSMADHICQFASLPLSTLVTSFASLSGQIGILLCRLLDDFTLCSLLMSNCLAAKELTALGSSQMRHL